MHARVTTFSGSPEQAEDAIRYAKETVIPTIQGMNGFRGMLYLVDRGGGGTVAVTLWENADAMKASEEAADSLRDEGTTEIGGQVVSVGRYEVAFQEMP